MRERVAAVGRGLERRARDRIGHRPGEPRGRERFALADEHEGRRPRGPRGRPWRRLDRGAQVAEVPPALAVVSRRSRPSRSAPEAPTATPPASHEAGPTLSGRTGAGPPGPRRRAGPREARPDGGGRRPSARSRSVWACTRGPVRRGARDRASHRDADDAPARAPARGEPPQVVREAIRRSTAARARVRHPVAGQPHAGVVVRQRPVALEERGRGKRPPRPRRRGPSRGRAGPVARQLAW